MFKDAFAVAGPIYFNPSFRKTLAQLARPMCKSPEKYKT
jgi:hypothetical protein